jgi:hypothetical protein
VVARLTLRRRGELGAVVKARELSTMYGTDWQARSDGALGHIR